MSPILKFAAAALLACLSGTALADPASLLSLQRYDRQLAAIGYRLAAAGGNLCSDQKPMPGFLLHDLSQYAANEQADARAAFGFTTDPLILAVAPTSPAAEAGLREGDAVLRIEGEPVPRAKPRATSNYARMAAMLKQLDHAMADGVVLLTIRRDGQPRELRVPVRHGCVSRFQIRTSGTIDAKADGTYVEITTGAIDYAGEEDQIAVLVAHEMAHNILRHRVRLDDKRVRRGLLGSFGRSARLMRQTEDEADTLSLYLLDRAGYDPRAMIAFWQRYDRSHLFGFLNAPTHRKPKGRIARAEVEIARITAEKAAGRLPQPEFMHSGPLPELR